MDDCQNGNALLGTGITHAHVFPGYAQVEWLKNDPQMMLREVQAFMCEFRPGADKCCTPSKTAEASASTVQFVEMARTDVAAFKKAGKDHFSFVPSC
jgi:hypothetical protein